MNAPQSQQEPLNLWERGAMTVAGVALLALALALTASPAHYQASFLFAYLFWLGISLGSLGLLMLHHLTGGGWGFVIRRILEAAAMTLPAMALIFIPMLFELPHLYAWANPHLVAANPVLAHRAGMYTIPFFVGRAVLYFACWITLATLFRRWSLEQDRAPNPELTRRMQLTCGPGLVILVFTVSFAIVDWIMALEPDWYSTVFGMLVIVGQGLGALAFAILIAVLLAGRQRFEVAVEMFHDLGGLLLAFVALWLYLAYSQFIIIWSGDLPHETGFFRHRSSGGWGTVSVLLILTHFALPFSLLLFGGIKRNRRLLGAVAALVLAAQLFNDFWLVAPSFHPAGFTLSWTDVIAPIFLGGIWMVLFVRKLRGKPLIPLHDPRLETQEGRQEMERVRKATDRG